MSQPKALFLADVIKADPASKTHHYEAAAELRRLHDETLMLEGGYESACKILSEQDKKLAELEAVNRELLEALRLTSIDCQYLHHAHKDRHLLFEECPVVARINAAIAKAEGEKT
jgi:hypothetical protein